MNLWRWMVCVVALGPFVYYVLATYCSWDYFRKVRQMPAPDGSFTPTVSILKPVRGVDREAYQNFVSFCRLDYPDYEIVFAVSDPDDEVIPWIEKLQRTFPNGKFGCSPAPPKWARTARSTNFASLPKRRGTRFWSSATAMRA